MSVSTLTKVMQHYPGAGGEYTLALCLGDAANDAGAAIFPSVATLAHNSRQSARTVQRQLKAMVAGGWLEVEQEGGGAGRPTRYRINPAWMHKPADWKKGDNLSPFSGENGDTSVTLSDAKRVTNPDKKGDIAVSPEQLQNLKSPPFIPPIYDQSGCAVPSDGLSDEQQDRALAEWIFALVLALHPKHRPPNWKRWCKEIRLLRERDGCSRREIAGLFRWANGDKFWRTNVLSPGTLRKQWDKLVIKRQEQGGGSTGGESVDYRCVNHPERNGRRIIADVGWCCAECIERHEHAEAQACGVVSRETSTEGVR